ARIDHDGDAVAYDAGTASHLDDMAYDLGGRSSGARLRINEVAGQSLKKFLIERRSLGGDEHWPLFAREIVWQDEAVEIIRDDEVTSRTRIISRKQEMSIRDDDCVYVTDLGIRRESKAIGFCIVMI